MKEPTARELDVVGQRVRRVDGVEKVDGTGRYIADLVLPRMLHGAVLRSPYPHASIKRIDKSRALQLPGVVAVIDIDDTPKKRWPWGRCATWGRRSRPSRRSTWTPPGGRWS
jgi:CO/xanthine dehydrogenase Mo-binding subunit